MPIKGLYSMDGGSSCRGVPEPGGCLRPLLILPHLASLSSSRPCLELVWNLYREQEGG